MKTLTILILLCLASPALAADNSWTWTDTGLEAVTLYTIYVDWKQSDYGAARPNKYYENGVAGWFIGEHPSRQTNATYFICYGVAHAGIAYLLPKEWKVLGMKVPVRTLWQATFIIGEINTINRNYQAGIRIAW